jgi:hypothetical protein
MLYFYTFSIGKLVEHLLAERGEKEVAEWANGYLCLSSDVAPQGWVIARDFSLHLFVWPCEGRSSNEGRDD